MYRPIMAMCPALFLFFIMRSKDTLYDKIYYFIVETIDGFSMFLEKF